MQPGARGVPPRLLPRRCGLSCRPPHDLLAVATDDVVEIGLDAVFALAAVDVLGQPVARVDQIVAVAAEEAVDAWTAFQVVAAEVAPKDVVAAPAEEDVVARSRRGGDPDPALRRRSR